MRNIVYRIFLILTFLLLYVQVFNLIAINDQKPSILLILVLYIAQKKGVMEGQLSGFLSGLGEDIFSVQLLGIHSFTKLIVGHISGYLHNNIILDHIGVQFILGLIGGIIEGFLFIIAKLIFDHIDIAHYITNSLWIKVLYTALLTPLIFLFLDFLEKHFGEP